MVSVKLWIAPIDYDYESSTDAGDGRDDYSKEETNLEIDPNTCIVKDGTFFGLVCNAFDKMTGMEYINFVADIFKVSKKDREERIKRFQENFSLGEAIHKSISSYSHGMKQKISIMASLISNPKLWILDEPITGLDTQTSLNLLNYMKEYSNSGNAVLFSSHNLDIVQKICDRAIVIDNGNLVANLDIEELENLLINLTERNYYENTKR